jgi:alpha-beta hydrolase superfamily lysophospholipase
MVKLEILLKASDEIVLYGFSWMPESGLPKACLLLVHGMAEHIGRYHHFASFMADKGFAVYGFDLRGHGITGEKKGPDGFFAEENGWPLVVEDIDLWVEKIREDNPGLPVVLMGHSMGSFLARNYAASHGEKLAGLILSGTGKDPGIMGSVGILIARIESEMNGKRAPSILLDRLTFGPFTRSVKQRRTRFDWLSRDDKQVDAYIADPLCGRIMTAGFYYDFLRGLRDVGKPSLIRRTPLGLPVYFCSGSRDPVGGFSRGVAHIYKEYRKAGLSNLSLKFYSDGRHEMLNETNRDEVYRDILAWITSKVSLPPAAEGPGI